APEPALVTGALEGLQQRVAVPGRAVADRRSLVRPVRPRTPDELGTCSQQLLVEVRRRARDDPARARAPLQADLSVVRKERRARLERPVGETVLDHRPPRE